MGLVATRALLGPVLLLLALCIAAAGEAPHTNKKTIHFLVLGDWGKPLDEATSNVYVFPTKVAAAMVKYVRTNNIPLDYVVSAGDNFYMKGVTSVEDPLWDTVWRDVYLKSSDALRVPWHAVLGNHDYNSGPAAAEAQIERTTATDDDEWQFPAHDYSKTYSTANGMKVHTVFVDTNTLAPGEAMINQNKWKHFFRIAFFPIVWTYEYLLGYDERTMVSTQLAAIEAALKAGSRADWLVVVGHHPVFSPGSNGDTQELQRAFMGLLEQYGVDAYFCGHDHLSAHMRNNGIEYFVAGAGALYGTAMTETAAQETLFVGERYGAFAAVEATGSEMRVAYVTSTGATPYKYTMRRKARPLNVWESPPSAVQSTGEIRITHYLIVFVCCAAVVALWRRRPAAAGGSRITGSGVLGAYGSGYYSIPSPP